MKLKLNAISIYLSSQDVVYFTAKEVLEYDELGNGIVIKMPNGEVRKFIGAPYVVSRVTA